MNAITLTAHTAQALPAVDTDDASRRRDELALVRRCQQGEVAAFDALYRQQVARLRRVCCALLDGSPEADDAVQVVFTRAFGSIHKFDGRSAFSTWLHAIAIGEASNIRRGWRRQRRLKEGFDLHLTAAPPASGRDPERAAAARRLLAQVHDALAALGENKRVAFILFHGAGLSLSEVAATMRASVQTTAARIKAAQRDILKQIPEAESDFGRREG